MKYMKIDSSIISVKVVKDASCSPNGEMPIFVNEQDGKVLLFDEILSGIFNRKISINQVHTYIESSSIYFYLLIISLYYI